MRRRRSRFLFDTVTLSNFVIAGRFYLLLDRYGTGLFITPEVLGELEDGIIAGYQALRDVETAVDDGRVTLSGALTSPRERETYRKLLRTLAPGEASCIAQAGKHDVVVTDDRVARECCQEWGIAVTGTIGILKACVLDKTLSPEEADLALQAMVDGGYYSPVRSISSLL